MSNHLIDVQQIKNGYNTNRTIDKLWLTDIRSLSTKALFVNDLINDHNLDFALFDRNMVKKPDEYIILNESTPQDYCTKMSRVQRQRGRCCLQFITIFLSNFSEDRR